MTRTPSNPGYCWVVVSTLTGKFLSGSTRPSGVYPTKSIAAQIANRLREPTQIRRFKLVEDPE